jgi:hypothetical protein
MSGLGSHGGGLLFIIAIEPDEDDVNPRKIMTPLHTKNKGGEDARLAQQMNDETLARALQDAEYGSSDDYDEGGGGGGFLPADVAAELRVAKSRQSRRDKPILQEKQDEIMARNMQREEDFSAGVALHQSSNSDSDDEGGGGFFLANTAHDVAVSDTKKPPPRSLGNPNDSEDEETSNRILEQTSRLQVARKIILRRRISIGKMVLHAMAKR